MTKTTDSLLATEAECAKGRTAPRVSLADIQDNIMSQWTLTGEEAARAASGDYMMERESVPSLRLLTICLLVLRNGFTVIGKSAPASADNFDADLGARLAREDAIRQCWPLMGYALRDAQAATGPAYQAGYNAARPLDPETINIETA